MLEKIIKIKKDYGRLILILFLFFISFYIFYIYLEQNINNNLRITFFDIGQGDSSLIEMPTGEKILIDAGPSNIIVSKLQKHLSIFNRVIDFIVLTHPDSDHVAGFYFITPNFYIKNILENGDKNKNTDIYKNIEKGFESKNLKNKEIFANCGDKIVYKNDKYPKIFILHPDQSNLILNDTNENSIVLLLIYGKFSFLFTGDMDKEVEKNIFREIDRCFSNEDINTIKEKIKNLTVLKVSHHGSKTASSDDFIKKIKPKYSIISAGEKNRYGHPNEETIKTLEKYKSDIFYTKNDGNISFITDGDSIEFKKEK